MGVAAVLHLEPGAVLHLEPGEQPASFQCRVGGPSSSFQAELAFMCMAVIDCPVHQLVVVMTDSMNVIQALEWWGHGEYFKEMAQQCSADIMKTTLAAFNQHVKSHLTGESTS